jgi:type VI secretion system protein ImpA
MPIDIEALLQPIPGGLPSGPDLRYHPITDQIKEARREEADISQGVWKIDVKAADYPLVLKLCRDALTKRGKDLQIAGWMTEALLQLEGFAGLRQGLQLIYRLLDTYWDSVYPQMDEDGDLELRATPLRWVGSQLDSAIRFVPLTKGGHNWYQYKESLTIANEEDARNDPSRQAVRDEAIAEGKLTPEEFDRGFDATPATFCKQVYDELTSLLEFVATLQEFCNEKFGDASPEFRSLRLSLEEVHQTARILIKRKGISDAPDQEGAEPAEEAEAAPDASAPQDSDPAARQAPRRSSGGAEPASSEDAADRILAAVRFLRKENPANPAPYLIARALRWGELRATGGVPDPAVMVAPPTDVRVSLKRLATEGSWDQVLQIAEDAAARPCGRAWLDVQRYVCYGLSFAGNDPIAQAILSGLRSLLADLPQLVQWTLADDTPTANPETMQWLKDQNVLPGSTTEPVAVEASQPAQERWSPPPPAADYDAAEPAPPDPYDLAMEAARSGHVEDALGILSREVAHERSGRGRFLRRVQLAQVCLATGNDEIGRPILQEIAEEIQQRQLEDWENTDLISHPLGLLYRCLDEADEKRKLYARICRLDPSRALGLK